MDVNEKNIWQAVGIDHKLQQKRGASTYEMTLDAKARQYLDQAVVEELGLPLVLLMERAGLALAHTVKIQAAIQGLISEDACILVVCGPGGNGGDAYAAARALLTDGYSVGVFASCQTAPQHPATACMRKALEALGVTIATLDDLVSFLAHSSEDEQVLKRYIVVDGLYGAGLDLSRGADEALEVLWSLQEKYPALTWVACDVPSGVDADSGQLIGSSRPRQKQSTPSKKEDTEPSAPSQKETRALKADAVCSLMAHSTGLFVHPGAAQVNGFLHLGDLGLPSLWLQQLWQTKVPAERQVRLLTAPWVAQHLGKRAIDSHKYKNGSALLLAGSDKYPGAALLAARACQQAGIGMLYSLSIRTLQDRLLAEHPAMLAAQWADERSAQEKQLLDCSERVEAVLLGPGLDDAVASEASSASSDTLVTPSASLTTERMLELLVLRSRKLILDATALNCLAERPQLQAKMRERVEAGLEPAVLTPHEGECRRLLQIPQDEALDRLAAARRLAAHYQAHVLLKGPKSILVPAPTAASLRRAGQYEADAAMVGCVINCTGSMALARAGSGDLLAGLLLALAAQSQHDSWEALQLAVWLHGSAADVMTQGEGPDSCSHYALTEARWIQGLNLVLRYYEETGNLGCERDIRAIFAESDWDL